jgi:NAD(P)H-hydrate epimerase
MTNFPTAIHTAEQVRQLERYGIEKLGIPGYTLMTRAGTAALRVLRQRWPSAKHILVVCGSGNNAGDGYVVARLARQAGLKVTVIALFEPDSLRGEAQAAYRDFAAAGNRSIAWLDSAVARADVIVDAIFGIGLSRPLDANLCAHIRAMNAASAPILALDIPSGLDANTGQVLGEAIKADCTISFVGLKLGLYLGVAPDFVGEIAFDALEIASTQSQVGVAATRIDEAWLRSVLPRRSRLSHKGSNGHVLVIGGGVGMAGAVRLTGEACLRVGAGLVTVATHPENVPSIVTERPELIVRALLTANDLESMIERADVVAMGPGMGTDAWAKSMFELTLRSAKPMVVDADALNLLAVDLQKKENWILTPHPGEAGRLLGSTSSAIQSNRLGSAKILAQRYGGVVVLKGANTLIAREEQTPMICDRGNPAMATPGMGDVLTGVIAGLLGQLGDLWIAACAGTFVHAVAGDLAVARLGDAERGLIASDLFAHLPACVSTDE